MKIYLPLFLLLISLGGFAQEETSFRATHRALYKMTYKTDQNASNKKEMYMELLIGDSTSLFRSLNKSEIDSFRYVELYDTPNYQKPPAKLTLLGGTIVDNYQIKKNNEQILTYENFDIVEKNDHNFVYQEESKHNNWKLGTEVITIGQLNCQNAQLDFGGRNWTAWFAPEIPIKDGPYKFSGLPGLIVSITDSTESWQFDLINLTSIDRITHFNFDKNIRYKKVNRADYFSIKKDLLDNMHELLIAANRISFGAADRKIFTENRKKDNNWIELMP